MRVRAPDHRRPPFLWRGQRFLSVIDEAAGLTPSLSARVQRPPLHLACRGLPVSCLRDGWLWPGAWKTRDDRSIRSERHSQMKDRDFPAPAGPSRLLRKPRPDGAPRFFATCATRGARPSKPGRTPDETVARCAGPATPRSPGPGWAHRLDRATENDGRSFAGPPDDRR